MNNFFSPRRFGKYFLYDLTNTKNNFGLTILIVGLIPVISFVIYQIMFFLTSRGTWGMAEGNIANRVVSAIIAVVVAVMVYPTKVYGPITDKKAGSSFLMLPASTFEKWLSMALMTCVVVPAILLAIYLGCDTLLGLIFPGTYGTPVIQSGLGGFLSGLELPDGVSISKPLILWSNWCSSILAFTLGAICFKKGKIGKTILAIFALVILLSMILVAISGRVVANDSEVLLNFFDSDPDAAVRKIVNLGKALEATEVAALLALVFVRLRTIKH